MMQRNHVEALATRDLLKADAAREQKSSVVRVRKGVAAAKLPQGVAARKENDVTAVAAAAVQKVQTTTATADEGSVPFQSSTSFTGTPNGGFWDSGAKALVEVCLVIHGCVLKLLIHHHGKEIDLNLFEFPLMNECLQSN
jgi:hypothetical protein